MFTVYKITRNCCLGPCCSRGHQPFKPERVVQLVTFKKESAARCVESYNRAGYDATLYESLYATKELAEEAAAQAYPKVPTPRSFIVDPGDGDDSVVYTGFNRRLTDHPAFVAVVSVEGEPEIYALDNTTDAIQELRRYLDDQEFPYTILGVYSNCC